MTSFPVANAHSHAQPLLTYPRLLGVEPDADGALRIGSGGAFKSRVVPLDEDGHSSLRTTGDVRVRTQHGEVAGHGTVGW